LNNKKVRFYEYSFIGPFILSIISILSFFTSIYNITALGGITEEMATTTYAITNSAWEIRYELHHMRSHYIRNLSYDINTDVPTEEEYIRQYHEKVDPLIQFLEENDKTMGSYLVTQFDKIDQIQQTILTLLHSKEYLEVISIIETQLFPLYDTTEELLEHMASTSVESINSLSKESQKISLISNEMSLTLSLCIIILAIYFEYRMAMKNKSILYREELFRLITSSIDDVFLIYHFNNKQMDYISPNTDRILGIHHKSLQKNPMHLFYHADEEKELIETIFTKPLETTFEYECNFHHSKTKQLIWVRYRVIPIQNHQNELQYIFWITDLTKEKETQQVLKDALLNAQKANQTKKEFLSHMSHEIRSPIYAIIGLTKMAYNPILDRNQLNNYLDKVFMTSKQLLSLINDILDMSRIDSNKLTISKEPFSLQKFLEAMCIIINTQAELNQLEFVLDTSNVEDDCLIGDTVRLNQILINVITNSLKFTPTGGRVVLTIQEVEKRVGRAQFRFTITDNGIGMSDEFLKHIYEPFEQEDSTIAKKYGGSGLGMSITKNLVTLMGGRINVTSKQGIGTTTVIELDFDISTGYSVVETPTHHHDKSMNYDFTGHRILIVEDNEINLEITCELLKTTNALIETAHHGLEALKLFEQSNPGYYDVILMDIQMPKLNGYDTTKAIRQSFHPDATSICIIAMTAGDRNEDISAAMEAGMDFHIEKPIDIELFYDLLYTVL
jgi:PAS domain S-box-containing protein